MNPNVLHAFVFGYPFFARLRCYCQEMWTRILFTHKKNTLPFKARALSFDRFFHLRPGRQLKATC